MHEGKRWAFAALLLAVSAAGLAGLAPESGRAAPPPFAAVDKAGRVLSLAIDRASCTQPERDRCVSARHDCMEREKPPSAKEDERCWNDSVRCMAACGG